MSIYKAKDTIGSVMTKGDLYFGTAYEDGSDWYLRFTDDNGHQTAGWLLSRFEKLSASPMPKLRYEIELRKVMDRLKRAVDELGELLK